jgi:hypothetical protein
MAKRGVLATSRNAYPATEKGSTDQSKTMKVNILRLLNVVRCFARCVTHSFTAADDTSNPRPNKKRRTDNNSPVDEEPKYQVCPACRDFGYYRPHNHGRSNTARCPLHTPKRANTIVFDKRVTVTEDADDDDNDGNGEDENNTKYFIRKATVVMGRKKALRASQLDPVIQATVRTMTQWLVEGNAVFHRYVLHRLENHIDLPRLQQNSNVVRRCFASTQRRTGSPLEPSNNAPLDAEIISRRDEYATLRPIDLEWVDGRWVTTLSFSSPQQN